MLSLCTCSDLHLQAGKAGNHITPDEPLARWLASAEDGMLSPNACTCTCTLTVAGTATTPLSHPHGSQRLMGCCGVFHDTSTPCTCKPRGQNFLGALLVSCPLSPSRWLSHRGPPACCCCAASPVCGNPLSERLSAASAPHQQRQTLCWCWCTAASAAYARSNTSTDSAAQQGSTQHTTICQGRCAPVSRQVCSCTGDRGMLQMLPCLAVDAPIVVTASPHC